jgi:hypothetical protein
LFLRAARSLSGIAQQAGGAPGGSTTELQLVVLPKQLQALCGRASPAQRRGSGVREPRRVQ